MSTQAEEHYAKEATRLLSDDTLATAFEAVRLKALVALGEADAFDAQEILRLQARAGCLSDVLEELKSAILAIGKSDGGFSPNEPPAE